jgi:transcription-repair coupling factor (superfamily II helicase)
MARELEDRFGEPPPEVANLLGVLRLRILAYMAGAASVAREGGFGAVHWDQDRPLNRAALQERLAPGTRIGRHHISVPMTGDARAWLDGLETVLRTAAEVQGRRNPVTSTPSS